MSSLYACSLGLGCTLVLLGCSASPPGGADGDSTAAGGSSSGTTTGAPTTEPEIPTTSASTSDPDTTGTTGTTGTTDTTGSTGTADTTSASTTTAPGSTTLDDDTSSGTGTTAAAVCGDGVVDLGEACDDGNLNDEDACASDCSQAFAVEEMVAGHFHVCVRITGGRVKCWGDNPFGQLGLGDSENRGDEPGEMGAALPYVDLGAGNVVVQLSLGQYHSCARFTDGRVKCWGENYDGKLGLGDIEHRGDEPGEMGDALPFVDLGAGAKVLHLAASGPQTCALLDVGRVKCWGSGINGVLGNGNTLDVGDEPGEMGDALPFIDLGPFEVSSLWKGDAGACAALTAGGVKCWGGWTITGIGDTEARGDEPGEMGVNLPKMQLGVVEPLSFGFGNIYSCAVFADNNVRCWGFGNDGQLGLGKPAVFGDMPGEMGANLIPVDLDGPAVEIAASCARLLDGSVKCWGIGARGALGNGSVGNIGNKPGQMGADLPPIDLGPGRTAVQLADRLLGACARLDDGNVKCWGTNERGELGIGDTEHRGDQPGEMGENLPAVQIF